MPRGDRAETNLAVVGDRSRSWSKLPVGPHVLKPLGLVPQLRNLPQQVALSTYSARPLLSNTSQQQTSPVRSISLARSIAREQASSMPLSVSISMSRKQCPSVTPYPLSPSSHASWERAAVAGDRLAPIPLGQSRTPQIVRGRLRLAARREEGAPIGPQQGNPVLNIPSVP